MSPRRTAAIIPNWNGAGRLERAIESLRRQGAAEAEIIVVDNASTDGSADAAERIGARVIRLPSNRGFAAAVNAGVEQSESKFVAIINNDVELDDGWLTSLIAALDRHPDFGMATGRTFIQGSDNLIDGAGDALSLGFAAARLGYRSADGDGFSAEREVLAVSGTACLIRREVFRRVGGFEEAFFAYLEDVDFCLRAQLAGFRALYVPEALAWHAVSASSGGHGRAAVPPRVAEWITAHQLLLARKYACRGVAGKVLPRVIFTQFLWATHLLLRGRGISWLRGLAMAARRMMHIRSLCAPPAQLLALLRASEQQIYADRAASDSFWKWYFRMFPPTGA